MRNQQIQKYAALISKYENRKKASRLTTSHPHSHDLPNLSHTLDSSLFKQVIQQKIKHKYNQPKPTKPLHAPASLSLHQAQESRTQLVKPNIGTASQQDEQQHLSPKENALLKVNNLTMNKSKTPIFINTSNLLSMGSPSCLKSRKEVKPSGVTEEKQWGLLRAEGASKKWKKAVERGEKLQKMIKYGYELDGSIFHFQHAKTQPSEMEEVKEQDKNSVKAERQRIYQLLKSTSPLVVTPKILKTINPKAKTLPHEEVLWPRRLTRKKYPKSQSQRMYDRSGEYQFKATSMYLKETMNGSPKRQEAITAWDYEEEF